MTEDEEGDLVDNTAILIAKLMKRLYLNEVNNVLKDLSPTDCSLIGNYICLQTINVISVWLHADNFQNIKEKMSPDHHQFLKTCYIRSLKEINEFIEKGVEKSINEPVEEG